MSIPVSDSESAPRGTVSFGSRVFITLLLLIAVFYGAIVVYHLSHPAESTAGNGFLERCRKICQRYGLVPTGDIRRDAEEYLKAVGADSSRGQSDRWRTEADFQPVPSQPHPLLGHPAPGFALSDERGGTQNLESLVTRGPVVVVFYYGFQCSHCVAQLYGLSADRTRFRDLGAEIVALSADSSEQTARQLDRYGRFGFPVLADPGNRVAGLYAVYQPATDTADEDLLHGTFLIDRQGRVVWAYRGNEPFTDNASLLAVLAGLDPREESPPAVPAPSGE